MKFHRIENPSPPDEIQVATLLENGVEGVVLPFSRSDAYDGKVLGKIDLMCKRFCARLNVRFYGHYGSEFDGRALVYLPSVRSLNIDCIMTATHLETLGDLAHLEEFA